MSSVLSPDPSVKTRGSQTFKKIKQDLFNLKTLKENITRQHDARLLDWAIDL
jgi:hypothetical protein